MRPLQALGAALILAGGWIAGRNRARQLAGDGTWIPDAPPPLIVPEPELAPLPPPPAAGGAVLSRGGRLSPAEVAGLVVPSYGVPVAEALAYAEVESSFRPAAYRFEHHLGEASWGLMQVLESTARDRGLTGPPDLMFNPEIGMRLGLAHVAWTRDFLASRGAPADSLSVALAYNAGVGNALRGRVSGDYRRKWLAALARYQGQGW